MILWKAWALLKCHDVGAVCVYPSMVPYAVKALRGSGIPVASVATGFPAGLTPLSMRLAEIKYAVEEGAGEIDIVIHRAQVLRQEWAALYDEVAAMREACGAAHMKAILATGDLKTLRNVYKASMVAMQAGSDFIKTSTGKEDVNATLPVSLTMLRALRDYREHTGFNIGFKPAGGLKTAKDAMNWLILMKEEMGRRWLEPDLFRIGASSMLAGYRAPARTPSHRPLRGPLSSSCCMRASHANRHRSSEHHGLWPIAGIQHACEGLAALHEKGFGHFIGGKFRGSPRRRSSMFSTLQRRENSKRCQWIAGRCGESS